MAKTKTKTKTKTLHWLLAGGCLLPLTLAAQTPLEITGELRQRSEYRQNADFDTQLGDEQVFVLQRLRLGLHWHLPKNLEAFVQLQDSRLWGEAGSTTQPLGNADLYQAYFELHQLAGKPLSLRLGRQELNFGSRRLVAAPEWGNTGRAFEAARVLYRPNNWALDFWLAQIRDKNATRVDGNQEFAGAFFTTGKSSERLLDLYAFVLVDDRDFPIGSSSGKNLMLGTLGGRLAGTLWSRLAYDAEGALQSGRHGSLPVGAYALALQGQLRLWQTWAPQIGVAYKFGSGDSDPNDNKLETFSALFPAGHGQFGAMDYASWSNIADVILSADIAPAPRWQLRAQWHYLRLAHGNDAWYAVRGFNFDQRSETLLPARPGDSITLGHEFDLQADCDVRERVSLSLGLSRFFVGDFVRAGNPEADDSNFAYLSIKMKW
ncbi:MAG: alginate export family protein [candidate division KSB1 bacterium]|nr:alginate export family protein [candidate division KSB1 bacterium]MDZ7274688.1 alginate export family protein [candidate division KSB1 bacterium]MDZ7285513.1 alginate export family protein [candidate division KSB1 bacterium]MDZ7298545.1 alginate export family protein [candidate division KSB1 bacterium]MDZ7306603.1 alginate export family protein [candidate division KSB1 bacterium]